MDLIFFIDYNTYSLFVLLPEDSLMALIDDKNILKFANLKHEIENGLIYQVESCPGHYYHSKIFLNVLGD